MAVYPAFFTSLAKICAQVKDAAQLAGFSPSDLYWIELAVDEACANIIEHAYGGEGSETITVECFDRVDRLVIEIRDNGQHFDPRQVPDHDVFSPVHERREGGLGLFYMRHVMDEVAFLPQEPVGTLLRLTKLKHPAGDQAAVANS